MLWWNILGNLNDENVRRDQTLHIVLKLLCLYYHQSIDSFSFVSGQETIINSSFVKDWSRGY